MATITTGYQFTLNEKVTPQKLNSLIDLATLSGLGVSNFNNGATDAADVIVYGNTAPPLRRGMLWYDTTVGAEGLKYAFVSASNSSFSRWLYVTPRRDGVFWTSSGVSAGYPCFMHRGPGFLGGLTVTSGFEVIAYDGICFPRIWFDNSSSQANCLFVVPVESAGASSPVVCAWAGFVQGVMGNSPLTGGAPAHINLVSNVAFRDDTIPARSITVGIQHLATGAAVTTAPITLWGSVAYEDRTP